MKKFLLILSLLLVTVGVQAGTPPPVLGGVSGSGETGSRILPGPESAVGEEGRNYLSKYLVPGVINGFIMILFFSGVAAIIVAGLMYVLSSGDQELTGKARDVIFWAIVGTVIAAMAYAMVLFAVNLDFYGDDLEASSFVEMDTDVLFPTWSSQSPDENFLSDRFSPSGIIGFNKDLEISDTQRGEKAFMVFIPRIIDIAFFAVAPIVVVMFVFSGVRFFYAGDSDEDITSSKKMFQYALMGTIFMVLSFSFMKVVFMILSTP